MRWAFFIIAACAVVMLWGVGPRFALFVALLVLFVNFATVCLQYDDPIKRARKRLAGQLSHLSAHSEQYQRLQSTAPTPTADERRVRYGPLTFLNIGSGLAAVGMLVWGILLRAL